MEAITQSMQERSQYQLEALLLRFAPAMKHDCLLSSVLAPAVSSCFEAEGMSKAGDTHQASCRSIVP